MALWKKVLAGFALFMIVIALLPADDDLAEANGQGVASELRANPNDQGSASNEPEQESGSAQGPELGGEQWSRANVEWFEQQRRRAEREQERAQRDAERNALEAAERPERARSSQEDVWVAAGQDAVRAKLKDPGSARFEGVFFNRGADGIPVVCGYVNSRNSFGGYSGAQRFVATDQMAVLEEETAGDFGEVWAALCR